MLDVTYSLSDRGSGEFISEHVPLQLMDYNGKVTMRLAQITGIGSYELKLALASEQTPTIAFDVSSTSTLMSPKFSVAEFETP